ncbi:nicolin-1-like [Neocloeon triangulifer]|uniref:nicolin-1-like n=1 Tax=Neocloeon triangulifer TaxID=2078957 RepID=UPI00286F97AE|nr:nicolin-1-like [Neocloeon triangulifer]
MEQNVSGSLNLFVHNSKEVEFTVRGPRFVTFDLEDDHRIRPGSCILDIIFPAPTKVGEIIFRNYYTAWVSILIKGPPSQQPAPVGKQGPSRAVDEEVSPWQLAVPRKVIMPNPHYESGSHDLISISATESSLDWTNLLGMRILLQQPSPVWRTFHIEQISVLKDLPRRLANSNNEESMSEKLSSQTLTALRKSNAPEREGPPPKDFVGLVGYEVQGFLLL